MNSKRTLVKSLHVLALLGALNAGAQPSDTPAAAPDASVVPGVKAPTPATEAEARQVTAPKSYTKRVEAPKPVAAPYEVLNDVSAVPTPDELENLYPRNAEGLAEVKEMEARFNGPSGFLQRYIETRNYPAQNFFTTKWGSIPAYDTVMPTAEKADGLPETEKIDIIEFENADLNGVLRELARKMDISYITPSDIPETRITVQFKNMSPTDAFRALVKNNRKEVIKVFGAYTLRDPATPSMMLRRYKLSFNYEDKSVATSSGSALASGAGSSTGTSGVNMDLKPDYSDFLSNVRTLSGITFGEQPTAARGQTGGGASSGSGSPTVIYQETEKILTINAMQQGHDAVLTYLETINRPQENVELEVFVAETSVNPRSFTGVDWSFAGEGGYTIGGAGAFTKLVDGFATVDNGTAGAVTLGKVAIPNISATIRMLETDTNSKTYAHPSLLTTNNRPAILESVVEVPYQLSSTTSSTGSTTDSVNNNSTAFKRVGVTVGIRPILQDYGVIRVKVNVSISSVAGTADDGQPIISTRSYGGDFSVMNGEYIVIGGLGQSSFTTTNNAVPYLSALPILGNLFKSNNSISDTKNMLIFVRPSVKDSFFKGVKPNYIDKRASFAKFEEGKLNHNATQVTRTEASIKDPFAKSELQRNLRDVDARIRTLGLTREALVEEKKRAAEAEAAKVKAAQEAVDALSKELSENWDKPAVLQETATKKVDAQVILDNAKEQQTKVEKSFDEAIAPLEQKIEEAKKERQVSEEELKRLDELDKLYTPRFEDNGALKIEKANGVQPVLGAKVDDGVVTNNVVGESAVGKESVTSLPVKAAQPVVPEVKASAPAVPAPAPVVAPVTPAAPVVIPEPVVIAPKQAVTPASIPATAAPVVVTPPPATPVVVTPPAPVVPVPAPKVTAPEVPAVKPAQVAPKTPAVKPAESAKQPANTATKPTTKPKPTTNTAPAAQAPKEEPAKKPEPKTETLDLDALFKDLDSN